MLDSLLTLMCQTKESNKHAPGRVVIYSPFSIIYTKPLAMSHWYLCWIVCCIEQVTLNAVWCQVRQYLLFMIWTHPLQMKEYVLQYASIDRNKKKIPLKDQYLKKCFKKSKTRFFCFVLFCFVLFCLVCLFVFTCKTKGYNYFTLIENNLIFLRKRSLNSR